MHSSKLFSLFAFLSLGFTACEFGTSSSGGDDAAYESEGAEATLEAERRNEVLIGRGAPATGVAYAGADGLLFKSGLEEESVSCWESRLATGYAKSPCGQWSTIGSANAHLAEGSITHSGRKSMSVTFTKNEEVGGASLMANSDVINVRSYYYFAKGFDFGQGIKIGRVSSFNTANQANDIDVILAIRSAGSQDQCGVTEMADLGMLFNGKPVGYDFGAVTAQAKFERERWYSVEYQVKLNAPGAKDGSIKLWIDGALVASKAGLNIRGTGGSEVKLNRVRIGGWYSNGANGNKCQAPAAASAMYIDDVAMGTGDIGR